MRSFVHASRGLLLGVLSLSLASATQADTTASFHLGGGALTQSQANAIGWSFTVTDFVAVTSLGIWDSDGNGLSKAHEVGIFRVGDNALIIGASIVDGTQLPLIDGSRFAPVQPTTLVPGVQYYILGDDFTADAFASGPGSMGFAPQINWSALATGSSNSIHTTPTFTPGALGNLGPNFQYTVPASATSGVVGLAALSTGRRRRR